MQVCEHHHLLLSTPFLTYDANVTCEHGLKPTILLIEIHIPLLSRFWGPEVIYPTTLTPTPTPHGGILCAVDVSHEGDNLVYETLTVLSDKTYVGPGWGPGLIQCQSMGPV